MTRRFQDVDLSRLPPPAVETLDYEAIFAARIAEFKARWEEVRTRYPTLPPFDVEMLETDPVVIVEQADSYHEMLMRGRVNDAVRAVLLATSWGATLDHLGSRVGTVRFDGEADEPFRRRIQIAYEALSTAGPYGAYVWHTLSAYPGIKDAVAYGPEEAFVSPGEAWVSVLSDAGNGTPSLAMLHAVAERLGAWEIRPSGGSPINVWDRENATAQRARPLTDKVIVAAAQIVPYQIKGTLFIRPGPDRNVVFQEAVSRINAMALDRHRIGSAVPISLILSAAHAVDTTGRSEIEEVEIETPANDVGGVAHIAPWCTGIEFEIGTPT